MTFVSAALRRPAPVAALIGAVVLVLAAPAIALKTGPFSITQLPHDDPVRRDAELIGSAIGPGFEAPFVIVASTKRGTITEPGRLAALNRWQHRLAAQPGVQVVIGPGQIARRVTPLRETGSALLASNGRSGPLNQLGKLGRNLAVAAGGVAQLREGISAGELRGGPASRGIRACRRRSAGDLAWPRHRRRRQHKSGQCPRNLRLRLSQTRKRTAPRRAGGAGAEAQPPTT